jgi:hypothetical protein
MSTRDVAGIRQASIDRPDRVGVHSECGTQLAHWRETGARQQAARVDLVGKLPVDLGRDRDVRIAFDIEVARNGGRPLVKRPVIERSFVGIGIGRMSY